MKVLKVFLVAMFVMGTSIVYAGSTSEWLKGNDTEDPLMVSFYVAKYFENENEKMPDARIKFERKTNIGSFDDAEYTASLGLEF